MFGGVSQGSDFSGTNMCQMKDIGLNILISAFTKSFEIKVASYLSSVHNPDPLNGMILFSRHFGGDGLSPLKRESPVYNNSKLKQKS